jgi:hypothetical protein
MLEQIDEYLEMLNILMMKMSLLLIYPIILLKNLDIILYDGAKIRMQGGD